MPHPGRPLARASWIASAASSLLLLAAAAPAIAPFPLRVVAQARMLRERALADDTAYETLRSLTTEVGPRLAGSEGDARAVTWALARLRALGFEDVRTEPVKVPRWTRGEARAEILAPWPQRLVAVALGGSVGTRPGGIEADVVAVTNLDELKALPAEAVKGRIVFFTNRMARTPDVAGYGNAVPVRSQGAAEAGKLGAVGVVIRSVGTSSSRVAHTGGMRYDPLGPRIPALAVSNADADMVSRQLASGRTVRLRIESTSQWADSVESANVIGEIPGKALPREIVLLAAHLDSWDLGTGAHDDGAGVAIVTAAARLAGSAAPRRTLRVVLYANEEFGTSGAKAYARYHAAEVDRHVLGMESDLGAFAIRGMASRVPQDRLPLAMSIHAQLESMGIPYLGNQASSPADIDTLRALGMPVITIETDASRYFDVHHTADDTFDKVDPQLLRENVAAYATIAYLAAEVEGGLGRLSRKKN
jgi:carboxypeptidase Q